MQLAFVALQGLVGAEAMETVQLSSHSNTPLVQSGAVLPRPPSPKARIIYFVSLLAGGVGELIFTECRSGGDCTILLSNALVCFPNLSFS